MSDRRPFILMELNHADVLAAYRTLGEATAVLAKCGPYEDDEHEYGVIEFGEDGLAVGEVIRYRPFSVVDPKQDRPGVRYLPSDLMNPDGAF